MSRFTAEYSRTRGRRLMVALLPLLPAFALAQKPRPIDCRFLWFAPGTPPPEVVQAAPEGVEVECKLGPHNLSPVTRCTVVGGKLQFIDPASEKPTAIAAIPPASKKAILIFLPAPKPKEGAPPGLPLRIFVIDDSPKTFPDGGAYVINFYGKDIRFIIGENRNQLRGGGSHGFGRPQRRDPFNMAPVIVQFQQGEAWRTVSESALRFIPGLRYLIFAYVDPRSGRPKISTVQDIKPVVVKEEAG